MLPLYLEKLTPTELKEKTEALYELFVKCRICPNECMARRSKGKTGECQPASMLGLYVFDFCLEKNIDNGIMEIYTIPNN